jgi:class 3 adenylate cyclase/tetratricopeptide (TPR) repeat protein
MRAGVGVGELTAMQLGGVADRWDLALVGESLTQVGTAQTASDLGKVALSPEAWVSLADPDQPGALPLEPVTIESNSLESVPRRQTPPLALPQEADSALWAFVPAAVRSRFVVGQDEWIGELRRLTVMFVDIPALTAGPELADAQEMVWELQSALEHYEGSFDKLSVDEKGVKLIGVFGLPGVSHEDDPVRAVLTAFDMIERFNQLRVECSIGIATGRAFCGVLGSENRRDYTVMGDMVNLSARLMQSAEGGILCDEETYRAGQMRLAFRASRPIAIKGKAEPVTAYSPTGEHSDAMASPASAPGRSAAMVGRSTEVAELDEILTGLMNGRSEALAIEGEAGIGKSRLIEHLLTAAESKGARTLFGAGDAIEAATPYRAWRAVLSQLLELDSLPLDRETRRNHALAVLVEDEELAPLAPLLNAILPLEIPDSDLTEKMDADVRADNIRLIVTRLVQRVAQETPLLLVLDDAHWLDSSSWQLARQVFQTTKRLTGVIATRPMDEPLPPEYQAFRRACAPTTMALGPLPTAEIASLVGNTLGVADLPDEVVDLLRDKAEGHPLFSKELAYYLRNEGLIVTAPPATPGRLPQGRLAPGADLAEVSFPDTVQVVITSRIDKLDAGQQLMLKVASVIGRSFDAVTLQAVLPVGSDPEAFAGNLARLVETDLVEIDTPEPHARYMFKHGIIQEVAYGLLLFAQRRELHRAVATWYETTYRDALERHLPVLAHHWTMAEDEAEASKYQGLAGEQALANFANEEATKFLTAALDLSSRSGRDVDPLIHARWELHIGEAQVHWSRYDKGREHLEKGLALLEHPVPQATSPPARAWRLTRALVRQWVNRILRRRGRIDDPDERAQLLLASRGYTRLVETAFMSGDQWLALFSSFHALNLAEATLPSPELAEAYGPIGVIYGTIPWRSEAERYLGRAVETAREVESPSALGYTMLANATHAVGAADWDRAELMARELVELGRRVGARKRLNDGLQVLTSTSYTQGQFQQCVDTADELLASASRGHDPRFLAYGYFAKAYGSVYLDELDEAANLLAQIPESLGAQSATTDRMLELMYYALLSKLYSRLGRAAESIEAAAAARERQAGGTLDLGYAYPGYTLTAEALLELWRSGQENADLPENAKRACKSLKKFSRVYQVARPHARLCLGSYAILAGKPRRAIRHWRAAVESADRLGLPYVAGRAHLELARHLPAESPERTEHLGAAQATFEQLATPAEQAMVAKLSEPSQ